VDDHWKRRARGRDSLFVKPTSAALLVCLSHDGTDTTNKHFTSILVVSLITDPNIARKRRSGGAMGGAILSLRLNGRAKFFTRVDLGEFANRRKKKE